MMWVEAMLFMHCSLKHVIQCSVFPNLVLKWRLSIQIKAIDAAIILELKQVLSVWELKMCASQMLLYEWQLPTSQPSFNFIMVDCEYKVYWSLTQPWMARYQSYPVAAVCWSNCTVSWRYSKESVPPCSGIMSLVMEILQKVSAAMRWITLKYL